MPSHDPLLLALLTSASHVARDGLAHEKNRSRHNRQYDESDDSSADEDSRETTPFKGFTDISVKLSLDARLWPRNAVEGFIFGNSLSAEADIIIANGREVNVSRKHFAIQILLDTMTCASRLMLKALAPRSIRIESARNPPKIIARGCREALANGDVINAGLSALTVLIFPAPAQDAEETKATLNSAYMRYLQQGSPVLKPSSTNQPTQFSSHKVALSTRNLGSGGFGTVYEAFDEIGKAYAVKVFHCDVKSSDELSMQIRVMKDLKHVSLSPPVSLSKVNLLM